MGVIVNRPTDMRLATLFERIDIPFQQPDFENLPVYFGGPVQSDRGFVLHRPAGKWHSTLTVGDSIGLTSSRDVLQALARITSEAAKIAGIAKGGHLSVGARADICIFDPDTHQLITRSMLKSQGKNTPFLGLELPGRVHYTLVEGSLMYEAGNLAKR